MSPSIQSSYRIEGAGINIKEAVTGISGDTERDQKTLRTWSQN